MRSTLDPDGPSDRVTAPTVVNTASALPPKYTLDFVLNLRASMIEATSLGHAALKDVLPWHLACDLMEDAFLAFKAEPTLLEVGLTSRLQAGLML